MDWFTFVLIALATWRLSSMIVREDGPLLLFFRLREAVGITHDEDRHILTVPDRFWSNLLSCVWCSSIWIAADWMVLWTLLPSVAVPLAAIFAASAIAVAFDRRVMGN